MFASGLNLVDAYLGGCLAGAVGCVDDVEFWGMALALSLAIMFGVFSGLVDQPEIRPGIFAGIFGI